MFHSLFVMRITNLTNKPETRNTWLPCFPPKKDLVTPCANTTCSYIFPFKKRGNSTENTKLVDNIEIWLQWTITVAKCILYTRGIL